MASVRAPLQSRPWSSSLLLVFLSSSGKSSLSCHLYSPLVPHTLASLTSRLLNSFLKRGILQLLNLLRRHEFHFANHHGRSVVHVPAAGAADGVLPSPGFGSRHGCDEQRDNGGCWRRTLWCLAAGLAGLSAGAVMVERSRLSAGCRALTALARTDVDNSIELPQPRVEPARSSTTPAPV